MAMPVTLLAPVVMVAVKDVLFASGAVGVKTTVALAKLTAPGTRTAGMPEVRVKDEVVREAESIAWLKVALTVPSVAMPTAPLRGRLDWTVGAGLFLSSELLQAIKENRTEVFSVEAQKPL